MTHEECPKCINCRDVHPDNPAVYLFVIKKHDSRWIDEVLLCEDHLKCVNQQSRAELGRGYWLMTLEEYQVYRIMKQ
jgi:hypothetical protein